MLGSIQPDKLVPVLAGGNDGLIPRILWAWPEKMPPRRPQRRADMALLEAGYRRLDSLLWGTDEHGQPAPVILALDDDAADTFHGWEVANAASDGDGGSLYETFVGKMSGAVLRLALVSELLQWAFENGPEPRSVSERSVCAAIEWVEDYAKPMAQRVYGDAAVSVADRNAALLARYIRKHKMDMINLRELRRHPHKQHLKPIQANDALSDAVTVLEDAGWIMAAPSREGGNAGQTRKDYRVNPAVHGGGG